jgi:hypothetical protein
MASAYKLGRAASRKLLAVTLLLRAAVAVSLVLVCGAAYAAPFDLAGTDWEGCADFVQIAKDDLGPDRVIVTSRLDMHDLKREDAIILLFPEKTLDVDSLASFMRHGGRVVLLDDYGTGDALLKHFNIERVPLPLHPAEMLRQNPAFAVAEPASTHPVVQNVGRVVTNHATGVRHAELSPVLKVRAAPDDPGGDVLLAEAGAVQQGRFLAVGDPSIVINSMLRYPGNKAFARAILRYATDDDVWGKRGGRVFIASGAIEQRGSFGDDATFFDNVAEWFRALEDQLATLRKEGMPSTLAYFVAVAVGLAVVLWVGSRAGKPHKPSPPRFVRKVPLVAQGGVAGHAAVIGAPPTSRVLAMLELKSALEEDLCGLLDLDQAPGADVLMKKLAAAGLLDEERLRVLRRLLLRMANVETMVMSRRAPGLSRVRDREVVQASRQVADLLGAAHAAAAGRAERAAAGDAAQQAAS